MNSKTGWWIQKSEDEFKNRRMDLKKAKRNLKTGELVQKSTDQLQYW